MEKYIMTFEDGQHYVATQITPDDINSAEDGIITIIRCSDQKEYVNGEWEEIPKWGQ